MNREWIIDNVRLWIDNDESLYTMAQMCLAKAKTREMAGRMLFRRLNGSKTPDGAPYRLYALMHYATTD